MPLFLVCILNRTFFLNSLTIRFPAILILTTESASTENRIVSALLLITPDSYRIL